MVRTTMSLIDISGPGRPNRDHLAWEGTFGLKREKES